MMENSKTKHSKKTIVFVYKRCEPQLYPEQLVSEFEPMYI